MNPIFTETPTTERSFVDSHAGLIDQSTSQESSPSQDQEQDKMLEFGAARIHLKRIIDDWNTEVQDTEVRRKTRKIEVDTEGLRQKGDLDEDETIIPVRVIDQNITREQPPFINYLKNSRRLCTFRSISNPDQNPEKLETEFTQGMTYTGWENEHFKCKDGADAHGWAAIEVVYDPTKPLNVGLEYVEHDSLFWPRSVKKFQDSPRVIRCYDVTFTTLNKWVREFGFEQSQVSKLTESRKNTSKEPETLRIYKLMFKKEGVVFVSWFALTDGVDEWLKKPSKLFLGIAEKVQKTRMVEKIVPVPTVAGMMNMPQQVPEQYEEWQDSEINQYPFFVLPFRETEEPKLVDKKGRVYLDEPKQEAQTAILSGFVNGITRASNIFASPNNDDGTGAALKELEDIKLTGGRILSKPIQFWSPPYPDPMVLKAMQWFDVSNSQENNQVNFAVVNRDDSRKTAREIQSSEQQQNLLNSVQLTLFSTHIRAIYSLVWLMVQSQAMQNKIKFLLTQKQNPKLDVMGQPVIDPNTGQAAYDTYWENDYEVIGQIYDVRAAGDVDVIQKQELEQKMQQDWPVIQTTILRDTFLADYIKIRYGDKGENYARMLQNNGMMQNMQGMVARLSTIMQGMIQEHPEMIKQLPANEQAAVMQTMNEAKQFMPQQQQ